MSVNSRDVEAVIHDRCFFIDFDIICGDAGEYKKIYPVIHFTAHGKLNDANFESVLHLIQYKSIFYYCYFVKL